MIETPEESLIHSEEVASMVDGIELFFDRAIGFPGAFTIWVERKIRKLPVRRLAMHFHMSRYNIRKRVNAVDQVLERMRRSGL